MAPDYFVLSGDIDVATVPALRDELHAFVARTRRDVILDCADLSSIDRDGVRALIALRDRLAREGRCLRFVRLSDRLSHEILGAPACDVLVAQRLRVAR